MKKAPMIVFRFIKILFYPTCLILILAATNLVSLSGQVKNPPLQTSFEQFKVAVENSTFHLPWVGIGPVLNSARVESVQVDATKPGTMYVAFGSGNLWKTNNNGITWKPIFENKPSHGIGDIALAPSDPNILYVGTGESLRKQRNFTLPGHGIYYSSDAGETWEHRGLDNNWHVGEIAVHPTDPNTLFVAAMGKFWSKDDQMGVYKSTDAGKSWTRVLYVDDQTRANDIVISKSDPQVIYASMWENNIDTILFESVYGKNSSVYKSIDGGDHWEKISNGLPDGPKTGRIGLAVSHTNSNLVYALVDNLNKQRDRAAEIYQTNDGGKNWNRTHEDDLLFSSVIGWYFADIYVDPKDDDEIFALGVRIAHSKDGGKTFEYLAGDVHHVHPSAAQTLHLDHCEMWINPTNSEHLVVGNDGGLYQSYDRGQNWQHFNNIPTGEFYTITVEQNEPYRIFGGTQDDATVYGTAQELDLLQPDRWRYLWIDAWSGGDGCVTQIDPDDPNIVYFSMQEGNIWKMDMGTDTAISIRPRSKDTTLQLAYNFVTPYFISPHQGQTLYHGGNYLYKTANRGADWICISPDLSISNKINKKSTAVSALVESPITQGTLLAGTDHGAFWCSEDDGKHWIERSDQLADGYIRSIVSSKYKVGRVFLTMTALDYDDLNAYVYTSDDGGENWRLIVNNLPQQPANVILEDPNHEDILYLGMHRGVFISLDRGNSWELLGTDMPLAPVSDLQIIEDEKKLIIATHGRGLYYLSLTPIYEMLDVDQAISDSYLFPLSDIQTVKRRPSHRDVDRKSIQKIGISFWLAHSQSVELILKVNENQALWSRKIDGKKGINQFRWDQTIGKEQSDSPYFIHYEKYLSPGTFQLELHSDTNMSVQRFIAH